MPRCPLTAIQLALIADMLELTVKSGQVLCFTDKKLSALYLENDEDGIP